MEKVVRENDEVNKYNWAILASSYFWIARLACQELLTQRKEKHYRNNELNTPYKPVDLYVPILFNIKHGIELFIKGLSLFAYGEYERGHDIKTLFSNAKKKISELQLNPRLEGFYDDINQNDINASLRDLGKIEELVLYFFELKFLKEKLNSNFVIDDTQNSLLRYPDNRTSIRIEDWMILLGYGVQASDIKDVLTKSHELYELFHKVAHLHAVLSR